MRGVVFFSSLLLVSCSHVVQLKPAASGVKVSKETPVGCKDLGEVFGKSNADDPEDAMRGARNDLKNKAHAKGGNYVVLETDNSRQVSGNTTVGTEILLGGRALACSGKPSPSPCPRTAPAASAPAPATSAPASATSAPAPSATQPANSATKDDAGP